MIKEEERTISHHKAADLGQKEVRDADDTIEEPQSSELSDEELEKVDGGADDNIPGVLGVFSHIDNKSLALPLRAHSVSAALHTRGRTGLSGMADRVFREVKGSGQVDGLLDKAQHLSAIHASPPSCWPLLVNDLVKESWTVKDIEKEVKRIRELLEARPDWYECEDLTLANLARANAASPETCSYQPTVAGQDA